MIVVIVVDVVVVVVYVYIYIYIYLIYFLSIYLPLINLFTTRSYKIEKFIIIINPRSSVVIGD